jgi:hypothetical protein
LMNKLGGNVAGDDFAKEAVGVRHVFVYFESLNISSAQFLA